VGGNVDVAILKRLRASADWLGALAAALLAERYPEAVAGTGEQRLVLVDATTVVPPGDKRDYWLVHTVFDLTDLRVRVVEVSGRSKPERLARGGVRPSEVRLADRGHARADDLALVVAGGADFLMRAAANYPRLAYQTGCPLDQLALCRQATRERPADQPVVVSKGKSSTSVVARPVIIPLEPKAAQRARERARRNARHWGYRASFISLQVRSTSSGTSGARRARWRLFPHASPGWWRLPLHAARTSGTGPGKAVASVQPGLPCGAHVMVPSVVPLGVV
jgi:hypothetical protein